MSKKLIMACMGLVAFAAFALPAAASAKPALCETVEGVCKTLVAPQKIHAHNVGLTKFVEDAGAGALVTCKEATMTGTLTANTGSTVAGDIETASFTGEGGAPCESPLAGPTTVHTTIGNGVPWCVHAEGEEDKFTVRGGNCTEEVRSITFVLTTQNFGTCKYVRAEPIEGTLTTDTGPGEDAILSVTPGSQDTFIKDEGGFLCPASGRLEMAFTLTTDDEAKTTLYIENNP